MLRMTVCLFGAALLLAGIGWAGSLAGGWLNSGSLCGRSEVTTLPLVTPTQAAPATAIPAIQSLPEPEIGQPVLAKIPGLNSIFTNRSYVKDEGMRQQFVSSTAMEHGPMDDGYGDVEEYLFGVDVDRPEGLPQ